jgi:hypothetical protein
VGGVGKRGAAGGGGASIVSRMSGGMEPRMGTIGARWNLNLSCPASVEALTVVRYMGRGWFDDVYTGSSTLSQPRDSCIRAMRCMMAGVSRDACF